MRSKPRWILALLVALAFAHTPQAQAGGVVSTCSETGLTTALAGGGTVRFTCSGTITLTATITISSNTTIDGTGQNITISGGDSVRVFGVPSGVTLNLNKLTIAHGHATNSTGGGILNFGTLIVANSTFSNNTSDFGGAGIASGGTLTVTHSTFSGNSAAADFGGGISSSGTVTVTDSTFSGNSADESGAINNNGTLVTVTGSTFSGNSARGGDGGALQNNGNGALIVTNSTFSGNSALIHGGGINNDLDGTVTVTNSTFSGNSAGAGGGIANGTARGGTTTVQNTIVADSPSGGNCLSTIDGGGNLSWPDTSCAGINQDPLLDPAGLEHNGGPTQTIALMSASPAIDAAVSANCPDTDQRGVHRPARHCDIGAFQLKRRDDSKGQ